MLKNPLIKSDKLKRFASSVSERITENIAGEIDKIDCLSNFDIYTKRDIAEKLKAISECASLIELRKYDNGETRIHNANFCHNPVVCPVCADRVSKRRRALFAEPITRAVRKFGVNNTCGDWKSHYPKGYTGVYLATATIKDAPNLKERIDLLLDSIKRMRKMGQKRKRGRSLGEWRKVKAGLSNVEIKIGKGSGEWHAHIHFLLFTDDPLDYSIRDRTYTVPIGGVDLPVSKFNYEWFIATGGQGINFDLKPVQFRQYVNNQKCETFEQSVVLQAQEVIKYFVLLSENKGRRMLTAAQYLELIQRRGGRRLFNPIGLMRCDRRNDESFMTVTERELRRLEYVDEMDNKTYEIFASHWQRGGSYSLPLKQDAALFSSSDDLNTKFINIRRRAFMIQCAKYQGEYRRERGALFKSRYMHTDNTFFEKMLDDLRDAFRRRVSSLWEKFDDMNFLPEFLCDFNSSGMMGLREQHLKHAFC